MTMIDMIGHAAMITATMFIMDQLITWHEGVRESSGCCQTEPGSQTPALEA